MVVKLPPIRWEVMARQAVEAGVRVFHCCNTLPVAGGGMSGRPLKPVSQQVVSEMRAAYGEDLTLIGGGGIYDAETHELLGIFSKIYTHGSLRPTVVPHMGLVTPLDQIYAWLEQEGYTSIEATFDKPVALDVPSGR